MCAYVVDSFLKQGFRAIAYHEGAVFYFTVPVAAEEIA